MGVTASNGRASGAIAPDARPPLAVPRRLLRLRSDAALAERFALGDEAAFDVLYERYRPAVLSVCMGILGALHDAEDVTQETFSALAVALRANPPSELRPWLARVARNAAIDVTRRGRQRALTPTGELPEVPVRQSNGRAELEALLDGIRELPESQRTALLMRELGGHSYGQIATVLETHEDAVRGLIARARVGLRAHREASQLPCAAARASIEAEPDGRRHDRTIRRHLRNCAACRAYRTALRDDARALRALLPIEGGIAAGGGLLGGGLAASKGLMVGAGLTQAGAACAASVCAAGAVGGLVLIAPPFHRAGAPGPAAPHTAVRAHRSIDRQPVALPLAVPHGAAHPASTPSRTAVAPARVGAVHRTATHHTAVHRTATHHAAAHHATATTPTATHRHLRLPTRSTHSDVDVRYSRNEPASAGSQPSHRGWHNHFSWHRPSAAAVVRTPTVPAQPGAGARVQTPSSSAPATTPEPPSPTHAGSSRHDDGWTGGNRWQQHPGQSGNSDPSQTSSQNSDPTGAGGQHGKSWTGGQGSQGAQGWSADHGSSPDHGWSAGQGSRGAQSSSAGHGSSSDHSWSGGHASSPDRGWSAGHGWSGSARGSASDPGSRGGHGRMADRRSTWSGDSGSGWRGASQGNTTQAQPHDGHGAPSGWGQGQQGGGGDSQTKGGQGAASGAPASTGWHGSTGSQTTPAGVTTTPAAPPTTTTTVSTTTTTGSQTTPAGWQTTTTGSPSTTTAPPPPGQ